MRYVNGDIPAAQAPRMPTYQPGAAPLNKAPKRVPKSYRYGIPEDRPESPQAAMLGNRVQLESMGLKNAEMDVMDQMYYQARFN